MLIDDITLYKMAELPESEPREKLRNPCSEQAESSRSQIEDDIGLSVASPNEAQVSLLLPGDSTPIPARLSLTSRDVVLEVAMKRVGRVELSLVDLMGVLVRPQEDGSCSLKLHTFAYSKMTQRGLVPTPGRKHEVFTVRFPHQGGAAADCRAAAEQWKASLLLRCSQRCREVFVCEPVHQRRGECASAACRP